jgi:septum formation protein
MARPKIVPLILASASPRRRDLLIRQGLSFEIIPAEVVEVCPPHLSPGEVVLCNARAKAASVARKYPAALVLGVDTVVEHEGKVLGKPGTMKEASAMLGALNGKTHSVYSGVWLCCHEKRQGSGFIEVTKVHFHKRNAAERKAYLERIGPLDKAGAYAAQDDRGEMIRDVEGSFSNVVGLPMERFLEELARLREA